MPMTTPVTNRPTDADAPIPVSDLPTQFGAIDIYLFDQLLRGRITPGMRILDAGCGTGRNLHYFLRAGYDVYGADAETHAIETVRALAAQLAPTLPPTNFRTESIEQMSFSPAFADAVVSNTVLHFATDESHFNTMLHGCWRMLRPGGLFFCRLASSIGLSTMEDRVRCISGRRFQLPDGTERFLVDEAMLLTLTEQLGATLLDPIKTTVVQDKRCMTTWVLRKPGEFTVRL